MIAGQHKKRMCEVMLHQNNIKKVMKILSLKAKTVYYALCSKSIFEGTYFPANNDSLNKITCIIKFMKQHTSEGFCSSCGWQMRNSKLKVIIKDPSDLR